MLTLLPHGVNLNPDSKIVAVTADAAIITLSLYYEIDKLAFLYKIKEKDLLPIVGVLEQLKELPAKIVQRALGD